MNKKAVVTKKCCYSNTPKFICITYNFNSILDDNRKRKVCEECFVQAKLSSKNLTEKIQNKEPFYDEPLPILCNDAVVLGNYKKIRFGF